MEEPKSTAKRRSKTSVPVQEDKITLLPLSELHDFPNHPFKVRDDEAMQETTESIRQYGVLVPAIVRPREDGGYEDNRDWYDDEDEAWDEWENG